MLPRRGKTQDPSTPFHFGRDDAFEFILLYLAVWLHQTGNCPRSKSNRPPTERKPLTRCEFKELCWVSYCAFRKIMTNVNSTSDSMKAKLRIMAI